MRLYVAGPMRSIPLYNWPAFERAARLLRQDGHIVICPTEIDEEEDVTRVWRSPDGTVRSVDLTSNYSYDECLRRDLEAIETCEGIVLLPGWEQSEGALEEFAYAERLGLQIFEDLDDVPNGNGVRRRPFDTPTPHPRSEAFYAILAEAREMHDRKRQDYGSSTDPFANVAAAEEFGIEPWLGAVVRAGDKMSRLKTFARTRKLSNEGVEDSLLDLLVYAGIALALWREQAK